MVFPVAPPLVFAAPFQVRRLSRPVRKSAAVAAAVLRGDHLQTYAAYAGGRPGEVLVNKGLVEAHSLENLRPPVGLHRGNAHLGHGLDQALVDRLDEIRHRLVKLHFRHKTRADQLAYALKDQVGVDRLRAVTGERGKVMHLSGFAGLQHQPHAGAGALANGVMVRAGDRQQGRNGGLALINAAVRQNNVAVTRFYGLVHLGAHRVQGLLQALRAGRRRIQNGNGAGLEPRQVHVADAGQLGVSQHRRGNAHAPATERARIQQVALRADGGGDLGDQLLADAVQWRVGHLGEQLLEIVV